MIVTSFSYSRTVQAKQYEPVKIEAHGVPGEGQSAVDAFAELVSFVDGKVNEACGAANGSKPVAAPPLAKKQGAKKPDPTTAPTNGSASDTTTAPSVSKAVAVGEPGDVPFEPGRDVAEEPKAKAKRGRPKKSAPTKDEARVEYNAILASETLEQLSERFNEFRRPDKGFVELLTLDQWEESVNAIHAKYKSLMTTEANPDTMNEIIKGIAGERNAIDHKRQASAAA